MILGATVRHVASKISAPLGFASLPSSNPSTIPSIHRTRMHDYSVRRRVFQMFRSQTVVHCVLPHRRKESSILSLALDTENDYDVRSFDGVFNSSLEPQAIIHQAGELSRDKSARPANADRSSQAGQQIDIRTGHSRVQDVTHDRYFQSFN